MQKNLRIRKLQQKNLLIFPFFERKIKRLEQVMWIDNLFQSFYFFGIKAKIGNSGE